MYDIYDIDCIDNLNSDINPMGIESDKNESLSFCPECKGNIITISEKAEQVCSQCGLVLHERMIDSSHPEKRCFSSEELNKRSRTGPPISPLLSEFEMPTQINKNEIKDSNFKRALRYNLQGNYKSRHLKFAYNEIKRMIVSLHLPQSYNEIVFALYKKAYSSHLARGRGISATISACIYYIGRKFGYPITIKMLSNYIDSSNGKSQDKDNMINRSYRKLLRELHLSLPPRNPIDFIPLIVSNLRLPNSVERKAPGLLESITPTFQFSGKNPMGIAGASIYITCKNMNVKATKVEIANSIGITDTTLRVRVRDFQKLM